MDSFRLASLNIFTAAQNLLVDLSINLPHGVLEVQDVVVDVDDVLLAIISHRLRTLAWSNVSWPLPSSPSCILVFSLRSRTSSSVRFTSLIIWQLFFLMFNSISCEEMNLFGNCESFVCCYREFCKKVVDRISITLSSLSVKIEVPTLSDQSRVQQPQICNKTITTAAHIIIFIVITLHSDRCETLLRRWWRSTRLTSRTKLFLLSSQIPHLSRVLHSPLCSGVLSWPCFDHLPVIGEVSEISNLENLQTEAFLDLSQVFLGLSHFCFLTFNISILLVAWSFVGAYSLMNFCPLLCIHFQLLPNVLQNGKVNEPIIILQSLFPLFIPSRNIRLSNLFTLFFW